MEVNDNSLTAGSKWHAVVVDDADFNPFDSIIYAAYQQGLEANPENPMGGYRIGRRNAALLEIVCSSDKKGATFGNSAVTFYNKRK